MARSYLLFSFQRSIRRTVCATRRRAANKTQSKCNSNIKYTCSFKISFQWFCMGLDARVAQITQHSGKTRECSYLMRTAPAPTPSATQCFHQPTAHRTCRTARSRRAPSHLSPAAASPPYSPYTHGAAGAQRGDAAVEQVLRMAALSRVEKIMPVLGTASRSTATIFLKVSSSGIWIQSAHIHSGGRADARGTEIV